MLDDPACLTSSNPRIPFPDTVSLFSVFIKLQSPIRRSLLLFNMGGGPVAPHLKECPCDGYEVCEPRTLLSLRLASLNGAKQCCSKDCASLRGEDAHGAGKAELSNGQSPVKDSTAIDIPDGDRSWMRAMAMLHCTEQSNRPNQSTIEGKPCQNTQKTEKTPTSRHDQLEIGSSCLELPDDDKSWIQAMEVFHSSEQLNQPIFEGVSY